MHFEDHLTAPRGLGALPGWPHAGAAGGAACGDLIRIAVRVEGDRIAEAGFDADGCGAARAAGSAAVELLEGAPVTDAARITIDDVADALGGLVAPKRHAAQLAADALHRALGAAARDGALRLGPNPRRTLVAMSGGVDSAAAAQLALDAGDEVVAVTLELWSDPATDGEKQLLLSAGGHGRPRPGPWHGPPALHPRPALARSGRRWSTASSTATPPAARPTPACAATARCASTRCSPWRRRWEPPASPPATTRGSRGTSAARWCAPPPTRPRTRATCSPASIPRCSIGSPSRSGGLTKDAVRALAREAGLGVADKRESQDLCFVAGLGGREFLRRHGGPRLRRPGDIVDTDGRVLGRHEGQHGFTVGQRRGLGLSSREPLYVLQRDAATNRVTVGPRDALLSTRVRLEDVRLHRPADRVASVRLRYHAAPIGCRAVATGDEIELELERPAAAVAPGQQACLMSDDVVVGEGTIGEPA